MALTWEKFIEKLCYEVTGGYSICPYDVGDILHTENPTHPATRWPGTVWSQIEAGRFLSAAGSGYEVGSTGGDTTHAHGMGSAVAELTYDGNNLYLNQKATSILPPYGTKVATSGIYLETRSIGYGLRINGQTESGSQLPPYYAVYVWRRTA